jgi:hypothetical protein
MVISLISSPRRDLIFQNSLLLLITLHLLLSLFQLQHEFLSFCLLRHTQSLGSASLQKYNPIASSHYLVNGRSYTAAGVRNLQKR